MTDEARWALTDLISLITSCSVHFWEYFAPSTQRTICRARSAVGHVSDCRLRVSFICIVVGQGNPTRGPE